MKVDRAMCRLVLALVLMSGACSDDASRRGGHWEPMAGQPVSPGATPLSQRQLVQVAYTFHPQLNPMRPPHSELSPSEFMRLFQSSPQHQAHRAAQRGALARMGKWHDLVDAVRAELPPGHEVWDNSRPGDAAYSMTVEGPPLPGATKSRDLPVRLSILVPYYFYYEQHSERIDGLIQRDPIRYQVTPELAPILAVVEREIARRYGYWYLDPAIAATPLPGLFVNGHFSEEPPTLMDALFTTRRW